MSDAWLFGPAIASAIVLIVGVYFWGVSRPNGAARTRRVFLSVFALALVGLWLGLAITSWLRLQNALDALDLASAQQVSALVAQAHQASEQFLGALFLLGPIVPAVLSAARSASSDERRPQNNTHKLSNGAAR